MRGRKPNPTAARQLAGNPGHRAFNADEPAPPPVTDDFDVPPDELADQPAAQDYWRQLAPMLRRCGQVTAADRGALLALCIEWARYLEARTNATPRLVKTPSGYVMPNPWLSIQTKALAACMKLWPELGLTPSSRSRVKTAEGPGPGGDAFDAFDQDPPMVDTDAADDGTRTH